MGSGGATLHAPMSNYSVTPRLEYNLLPPLSCPQPGVGDFAKPVTGPNVPAFMVAASSHAELNHISSFWTVQAAVNRLKYTAHEIE